ENDARQTRRNQRLDARWCPAVMAARLQRDIRSRPGRFGSGSSQGVDFRVRLARSLVPALTYDLLALRDDAAYPRIRVGRLQPVHGQSDRAKHRSVVKIREHGPRFSLAPLSRAALLRLLRLGR